MPKLMASVLSIEAELAAVRRPVDLLECLQLVAVEAGLNVCCVWRVPIHWQMHRILLGRDIYPHPSVPKAFWPELINGAHHNGASPIEMRARGNPIAATWTEIARESQAIGKQRWLFDLAQKHSLRDGYQVPVREWRVNFWSRQVIDLPKQDRLLLDVASTRVVARFMEVTKSDRKNAPVITPRELAVLQFVSLGRSDVEVARALGLARSTVRNFMARATKKLGADSPAHAVALAIRSGRIP